MNQQLEDFYASLYIIVARLEKTHVQRLQCKKGCFSCCVDDITVFEVEAQNIKEKNREFLEHGQPAPAGRCAFLDNEGSCRIYDSRPYVCRTQGLPLRWIEGNTEYRDICPLNEEEHNSIVDLQEQDCFTFEPFEEQLALIQIQQTGIELKRVRLRDLFPS